MKSEEKLQKSYQAQKALWDTAKFQKICNCEKEIKKLEEKISSIEKQIMKLQSVQKELQEKEFESFESFRARAAKQYSESLS